MSRLKNILKKILGREDKLFQGHGDLFLDHIRNTIHYAEYGAGQSTIYVSKLEHVKTILTVDSSSYWLDLVKSKLGRNESKFIPTYINLGDLRDWGIPKGWTHDYNIINYASSILQGANHPDTILIDGRFRVYCFLFLVLNCKQITTVIFDDYVDREYYHIVERILPFTKRNQRQALFLINPEEINESQRHKAEILFDKFEYVKD